MFKLRTDLSNDGILIHRTCQSCLANRSSSWYKDLQISGAYICKQCYNQRYHTKELQPEYKKGNFLFNFEGKTCFLCFSRESCEWYRDEYSGGVACKMCFMSRKKLKK